jgi:acetylornithine deacetylase/succinyl-diaminopimelate desuccinylase-like protein
MVSREEGGLQEGTRYVMEKRGIKADVALIGEATNLDLNLACRGRIVVDLTVRGRSAHAANANEGINAIVKMSKVIDAIQRMKLTDHEFFGPTTQTITNILCQPGILNIVPNRCSISIDRRISPGDSLEKTKAEFQALIDQLKRGDPEFDADVETGKFSIPGYRPPEESVIKLLQESAQYVLQKRPRLSHYIFGTDGSYISGVAGIPWFGFGPGNEVNAHTVNDHIKIEDLVIASKVYAMFIVDLLS